MTPDDQDRLYLKLHGALGEAVHRSDARPGALANRDLQTALDIIDQAGSSCCPQQWSRFDQPE